MIVARRRGQVLLLTLTLLFALGIGAGVVLQRLGSEAASRRQEEARIQLRWLARSALLSGERIDVQLELPQGRARVRVRVSGDVTIAEASLPGFGEAQARRLSSGIQERYEREERTDTR